VLGYHQDDKGEGVMGDEQLKPCPFCGGEAMSDTWEYESGQYEAGVMCESCPADVSIRVSWHSDGAKELRSAIAAWNRRA
jgi:Lar family restriction alleviation protein